MVTPDLDNRKNKKRVYYSREGLYPALLDAYYDALRTGKKDDELLKELLSNLKDSPEEKIRFLGDEGRITSFDGFLEHIDEKPTVEGYIRDKAVFRELRNAMARHTKLGKNYEDYQRSMKRSVPNLSKFKNLFKFGDDIKTEDILKATKFEKDNFDKVQEDLFIKEILENSKIKENQIRRNRDVFSAPDVRQEIIEGRTKELFEHAEKLVDEKLAKNLIEATPLAVEKKYEVIETYREREISNLNKIKDWVKIGKKFSISKAKHTGTEYAKTYHRWSNKEKGDLKRVFKVSKKSNDEIITAFAKRKGIEESGVRTQASRLGLTKR